MINTLAPVEPLNPKTNHLNYYLDRTPEAFSIVREVAIAMMGGRTRIGTGSLAKDQKGATQIGALPSNDRLWGCRRCGDLYDRR